MFHSNKLPLLEEILCFPSSWMENDKKYISTLMKLFKIFGALLLLVLILIFLLKNTEEVAIDLIFIQYEQINIAFVMIGALAVGILIGYGVAVTSIISSKSESRSLKLKNRRLSDELNDLRNVAIDEGIYDNDDGED